MMKRSKKIPVLAGLLVVVFIALAAIEPTKDGFKNLQVLPKNISEDSLMKVMDNYGDALGVKCGFCHVMKDADNKEDYASDAKPEKTACRDMMRMTIGINKRYFMADSTAKYEEKVTCFTCHKGQKLP